MPTELVSLPDLNNRITVPRKQIEEFRINGHTLTPGLLSPEEIKDYRDVIIQVADKYNTEKRRLEERDTYGKAFLQILNLWQLDERVKQFVLSKRLAKVAADLLGVKSVRIYHDQALFKEPGGGHTPWHQDQFYWPLDTPNTITMWMPLVDIDIDMGMLTFASRSHNDGLIFDTEISDESEKVYKRYITEKSYIITRAVEMKAGDATWHYGFTIQQAPANNSTVRREVMTIIYMADGARVTQPRNKWQEADLKTWMMDIPVGSVADTILNPKVL